MLPLLKLINIQPFNQRISESIFSYALCEVKKVKQEAWVKDKEDVEYTLPINTCTNSIEIPNVFTKKNKFDEVIARDKSEVKQQYADNDNTQHPHHQRQEQLHRGARLRGQAQEGVHLN
jgi:predicted aldo/keto reductase-like oxidoreductase